MYVYFIQAGKLNGAIKIGYAKNPERRMVELQIGSVLPLRIVHKIKCKSLMHAQHTEQYYHRRFSNKRVHGEWFWCSKDLKRMGMFEVTPKPEVLPDGAQEHMNSILRN